MEFMDENSTLKSSSLNTPDIPLAIGSAFIINEAEGSELNSLIATKEESAPSTWLPSYRNFIDGKIILLLLLLSDNLLFSLYNYSFVFTTMVSNIFRV